LFYKELRTEQQLGYVVSAFEANVQGNKGMNFVVQSENTEPSNISAKIDKFLVDSEKILEDMTDDEFNQICDASEKNHCVAPLSLAEQSWKFFSSDILTHQYMFDATEKWREELASLKKWEVQNIYRKMFLADKKVLEVHIVSEKLKEEANVNLRRRNHFHVGNVRQLHGYCKTLDDGYLFK
jgi:secreted Zn-dependent insulinase-like peptidase